MSTTIELTPSFILHTRPYRNTSLLVEVFTETVGRIGLIAKGVRTPRAKNRTLFQSFQPLLLSATGKGELYSLAHIEPHGFLPLLTGKALLSGLYLNELLLRLLPKQDAHPTLFSAYHALFKRWGETNFSEGSLREFEVLLLEQIGYGIGLTEEFDTTSLYVYLLQKGFSLAVNSPRGLNISGRALNALRTKTTDQLESNDLQVLKQLMRGIFKGLLEHRKIKAYELFSEIA